MKTILLAALAATVLGPTVCWSDSLTFGPDGGAWITFSAPGSSITFAPNYDGYVTFSTPSDGVTDIIPLDPEDEQNDDN